MNSDTFVKITNKDIYNEIKNIQFTNSKEHSEIIVKLNITNGKVKLNRWIATTAISLTFLIIGFILSNI